MQQKSYPWIKANRKFTMYNKRDKMSRTLSEIEYAVEDIKLASFAKAMGHPVRIQILRLLNSQACCYTGDLNELIPLAQSTISQHLKALKDAGLIQGEIQPPKVKYCLDKENWALAKKLFSEMIDKKN